MQTQKEMKKSTKTSPASVVSSTGKRKKTTQTKNEKVGLAEILNKRLARLEKTEKQLTTEVDRRKAYLAKLQTTLEKCEAKLAEVKAQKEAEVKSVKELIAKVNSA